MILYAADGDVYSNHAKKILEEEEIDFTTLYPHGSAISDLKKALGLPLIAFPRIFVQGMHLGSLEDLEDAQKSGKLQEMLQMTMNPLGTPPDPLRLLVAARGGSIWTFQRYVYGNSMRVLLSC